MDFDGNEEGVRSFNSTGEFNCPVPVHYTGIWKTPSGSSLGTWNFKVDDGIYAITVTITYGNPHSSAVLDAIFDEIYERLADDEIL